MLGKRSEQLGLYEADNQYLKFIGKDSFHGYLAKQTPIFVTPMVTVIIHQLTVAHMRAVMLVPMHILFHAIQIFIQVPRYRSL
jgi:hypothetical protein